MCISLYTLYKKLFPYNLKTRPAIFHNIHQNLHCTIQNFIVISENTKYENNKSISQKSYMIKLQPPDSWLRIDIQIVLLKIHFLSQFDIVSVVSEV